MSDRADSWLNLDYDTITLRLKELASVFHAVSIVNPRNKKVVKLYPNRVEELHSVCDARWNRRGDCRFCIVAKAVSTKGRAEKFEFIDDDIYFVIAQYTEIEGVPYVIEMVSSMEESALMGVSGTGGVIEKIAHLDMAIYADSLTKAWNRRFYDEKVQEKQYQALAMIDIDHFKDINDGYGHVVGDLALRSSANLIQSCVRSSDQLIRYGGDEFILCFSKITEEAFRRKLQRIRKKVEQLCFKEYPDLHITLSIGGYYEQSIVRNLMPLADRMLYTAKEQRNTVKIGKTVVLE